MTFAKDRTASPAAGPEGLLFIDKGNGRSDETPGGRRPRKEVYIHAPDAVHPELDVAGTRLGVGWGLFAALQVRDQRCGADARGSLGEHARLGRSDTRHVADIYFLISGLSSGGLTSRQFVRYGLLQLNLGHDLNHIVTGKATPDVLNCARQPDHPWLAPLTFSLTR